MRNRRKRTFLDNLKNAMVENFVRYFKEYLIVTICFIIGVVVGVIFINNLSFNQSNEITTYVNSFIDTLKSDVSLDYFELLKNSIVQNTILVLVLWFVGATLIGMPLIFAVILFRGFCLGYTLSAVVHILGTSKGILFILTSIFLQNIIFIPAVIALAVSGIRLYQTVVKNRNSESIKFAILKHSIFSIIILILLVFSSIIEVFGSTNLLILCVKNF